MGNTNIRVGREEVVLENKLGQGGFSQVYLARSELTQRQYAMKVMYYGDQNDLKFIKNEIEIHKQMCQNEYVVPLIDHCVLQEPERKVLMLLDYCPVSAISVLEKTYPNPIKEEAILKMFYQICHAVTFMHSRQVPLCHRDLKVENILFKDRKFMLTDFGSVVPENKFYLRKKGDCALLDENIQKYTTMAYRAPEMINLYDYKPIGRKADVWALGCLLFKLCYFDTPFEESPMKIQFCKYSIPNNFYSKRVTQFFEKIFVIDPLERISTFKVMDLIAREVNMPNPYKEFINQKDPEVSADSSSLNEMNKHQQMNNNSNNQQMMNNNQQQQNVVKSSNAGLFWDTVQDVPTEVDEDIKNGNLFKPKTSGDDSFNFNTPHMNQNNSFNNSNNFFDSNEENAFDKSFEQNTSSNNDNLFSFDSKPQQQQPQKQQQQNLNSNTDLFDFGSSNSFSEAKPSQRIEEQTKNKMFASDLFNFGSPATPSQSSKPIENKQQTPVNSNTDLFNFGEFKSSNVGKAKTPQPSMYSNAHNANDVLDDIFNPKPKTPQPQSQAFNQETSDGFWNTNNDSFDFGSGQW